MPSTTSRSPFTFLSIAFILAGVLGGILIVLWNDPSGNRGSGLPAEFDYTLEPFEKIDPQWIRYRSERVIPIPLEKPHGVAVGPEDRIYVVGDRSLIVFDSQGKTIRTLSFDDELQCVSVAGKDHVVPGRIYLGRKDRVSYLDSLEASEKTWDSLGKRAVLTSIAVAEQDVFVADAGNRIVWHYNPQGTCQGRLGEKNESQNFLGFNIPSPYFDLLVAPDGLLRVTNPGAHRVEAFTFEGHRELSWGQHGIKLDAFCGCCNPAALAMLPDGRFVTGEKGIPRVKIYSAEGKFECVVVGPEVLAPNLSSTTETRENLRLPPVDLAVDSHARILVLDPRAKKVRIFVPKE